MRENHDTAVRRLGCAIALLIAMTFNAQATAQEAEVLMRTQWPDVRTGNAILRIEPLQRVMVQVHQTPNPLLLIRFPGGNRGNAWAFELRDWFVALGLDSGRIRLEPGSGVADAITIRVLNNG